MALEDVDDDDDVGEVFDERELMTFTKGKDFFLEHQVQYQPRSVSNHQHHEHSAGIAKKHMLMALGNLDDNLDVPEEELEALTVCIC